MSEAIEAWKERNLRRVDIQGLTIYVVGKEAQSHLENITMDLIKAKFAAAEMRRACARAAKWAVHDVYWPWDDRNLERRNLAAKAIGDAIDAIPLMREGPA